MFGADTMAVIVWSQGEGGGGRHVREALWGRYFGLIRRALFEGGGVCVRGGAGPAEWWNNSVLMPKTPLWSHRARLAADAASCRQCVMDLSVVPLMAPLKVVGLVGRGMHDLLGIGIVRC